MYVLARLQLTTYVHVVSTSSKHITNAWWDAQYDYYLKGGDWTTQLRIISAYVLQEIALMFFLTVIVHFFYMFMLFYDFSLFNFNM